MESWKIVSKIASAFGIIFIIFAAFASFINYEYMVINYANPPASFIQVSMLQTMTPFLLYAVLSFAVSATINRFNREATESVKNLAEKSANEARPEENKS
jgi:hypothetical protein